MRSDEGRAMAGRVPGAKGCFVTGTDTNVGKTRVSAALIRCVASMGLRATGFKPVAAGSRLSGGSFVSDDVRLLREAASATSSADDDEVGPCQLKAACAPEIAAAIERRVIDRGSILRAAEQLRERHDFVVVEGVGGFCVPLGRNWNSARLAVDLDLPVILVVGLRLGCINHALLTAQAIESSRLPLAGWIANGVDADMPYLSENLESLGRELAHSHRMPCLGVVPWLADPHPAAVATHLDMAAIRSAVGL
jgi:dethiobiotin synthetase